MAELNIYDSIYFRINKKHLRFIGLWPYDTRKPFVTVFWVILACVSSLPHFAGILVHLSDIDKLLEHLCIFLILTATVLKYVTLFIVKNRIKFVYDDIANIWLMITDVEEKRILTEYSNRGRLLTIAYMCLLTSSAVFFILLPLVPEILNYIDPLPIPRSHIRILNGEFMVEDADDYFVTIYLWDATSVLSTCMISHAIDSMYTITVEQGTALYAITAYRLSKLRHRIVWHSQDGTDSSYEWLVHIIKLHQTIMSFIKNINTSYSLCFIGLTIISIVELPVISVILIVHWDDPVNYFRWTFVFISVILHLFLQFWPGQKLKQHGTKLIEDAYCNEWYDTPAKTKKLLQIFMLRCSQLPLLTAGGLVEMNFEVYLKVVKTAASYVTVLTSFR